MTLIMSIHVAGLRVYRTFVVWGLELDGARSMPRMIVVASGVLVHIYKWADISWQKPNWHVHVSLQIMFI